MQKRQLNEWIKGAGNEVFFYKCLAEWESTFPQYTVNIDKAVEDYHTFLRTKQKPVQQKETTAAAQEPRRPSRRRFTFVLIAASILLITVSSWVFQDWIQYKRYQTAPGEVATWTLSDGTRVTLNASSLLKVPRFWRSTPTRVVYLKGEAEFDVVHTKDHRKFIVRTDNDVDVVVLGTVFTVFNRRYQTQIVLNSGKIQLEHRKGNTKEMITMLPRDRVIVDTSGIVRKQVLAKSVPFAPWKEKIFVFDETPLSEIVQLLRDHYHLNADITSPEIANLTVSGSFKALNADQFLHSLVRILDIDYTRNKKKVTFKLNRY